MAEDLADSCRVDIQTEFCGCHVGCLIRHETGSGMALEFQGRKTGKGNKFPSLDLTARANIILMGEFIALRRICNVHTSEALGSFGSKNKIFMSVITILMNAFIVFPSKIFCVDVQNISLWFPGNRSYHSKSRDHKFRS